MNSDDILTNKRVILFYNSAISALTLFAQHASESICAPTPLPPLSEALPKGKYEKQDIYAHPAMIVKTVNRKMGLPEDILKAEPDFNEQIDTPDDIITVYPARFELLDPPHQLMASLGCKLKSLPELRGRPPAEMELLRRAYSLVMES